MPGRRHFHYSGKPKELWKTLNCLTLPNKTSSRKVSALRVNKIVQRDNNLALGGFKNYFSKFSENILKKLPDPQIYFKHCHSGIRHYYKDIIQSYFNLATEQRLNYFKKSKVSKAADLNNLSSLF